MKAEEDLIDLNNRIYQLLMDEKLTYMECFAVLETVKSYIVGRLIKENMTINLVPVRLKK